MINKIQKIIIKVAFFWEEVLEPFLEIGLIQVNLHQMMLKCPSSCNWFYLSVRLELTLLNRDWIWKNADLPHNYHMYSLWLLCINCETFLWNDSYLYKMLLKMPPPARNLGILICKLESVLVNDRQWQHIVQCNIVW